MQTCTALVKLGDDPLNSVVKNNVTPPEVVILRAIHGQYAIECLGDIDERKHQHGAEAQRLKENYRTRITLPGGNDPQSVFSVCFPGANPNLPIRFSEIKFGPDVEEEPEEELDDEEEAEEPKLEAKRGPGRPAKAKPEPASV